MAYIMGEADEETVKRVEGGLDDEESEIRKSFEATRRKVLDRPPLPGDEEYAIKTYFREELSDDDIDS